MNIKKIISFALGPLATAAFGLISIPIIAWVFQPEDIGRLTVFQTTIAFFLTLTTLGLDQAYVREYHESSDKKKLLKECFAPGFIFLLTISATTLIFSRDISILLYDSSNHILYAITIAAVISSFLIRFLSLTLRMQERGLAFSMSQVLPKAIQLIIIITIALASFQKGFIQLLLTYYFSITFVLLICFHNTKSEWRPALRKSIDQHELKKLLKFGFPLIFSSIAFWGINATTTFAIHGLSNLKELAIYSIATSLAGVAVILQSIFAVIWTPLAFKWQANGVDMQKVDNISQQVLAIICTIVVLCGSFSWLIDFILPESYSKVKFVILCCIIQPLLYTLSVITSIGIGIARKNILSLLSTLLALITNIILSLALIPKYGASGAAISNSLSYFVLFIVNTEASSRVWRKFPRRKIYIVVTVTVALCIATVIFSENFLSRPGFFWASLIPVIYILFSKQWIEINHLLKNLKFR